MPTSTTQKQKQKYCCGGRQEAIKEIRSLMLNNSSGRQMSPDYRIQFSWQFAMVNFMRERDPQG